MLIAISFLIFSNIIISSIVALVNSVYEDVHNRSLTKWTILRAFYITNLEVIGMTPSERQNEYVS